ncbi:lipopolysaccharide heptosyltransferase II [Pseudodesulfovibrio sp. F-1]|uniref:Lipopolysaccharide heptosyltransferase II n=1 Tax=Pseudodesulfovibrio alkaliphilus TaxID=2661613 RepID=A0A7K1KN10_9BACT|nr:glycosyltransferase family 9 protein [Pseudodesulfovibrio alkaliphilus]MUM77476.1 lipopolysaccharide heptosyltransferase II [Pseudodesulfovibrio alkaliphilus]
MQTYRKIGVWQTAFLGDAVLTLPLLRALADAYPEADIHLFVRAGLEGLFAAQPELSVVHGFAKRGAQKSMLSALGLGREIGRQGFDLWISAHASLRSAAVAAATGIPRRIGYHRPWFNRLAYTDVVDRRFHQQEEVERLMGLLGPLGKNGPAPEARLVLPPEAMAAADTFWRGQCADGPVLGIHPGSTWPTKCWPVEYFGQVAALATGAGARVLVFAGPGEEGAAGAVMAEAVARGAVPDSLVNLAGRLSLPELAAWIRRLDAYLTNDSGPMHLAWVQETPLVALFGPTVRHLGFFPRGAGSTVMEVPLECRPCGLHGPRRCPLGHHDCMRTLTTDMVWEALAPKLLG